MKPTCAYIWASGEWQSYDLTCMTSVLWWWWFIEGKEQQNIVCPHVVSFFPDFALNYNGGQWWFCYTPAGFGAAAVHRFHAEVPAAARAQPADPLRQRTASRAAESCQRCPHGRNPPPAPTPPAHVWEAGLSVVDTQRLEVSWLTD